MGKRQEAPHASLADESFYAPGRHRALFSLLLVAAVIVCYAPAAHNGFLNYDDDAYVTNNPHVRAGFTWATVKWAFTTYDAANYHPVTWLSHALDCRLFGVNPAGHHEVSVLLHAANAVLLFLLLARAFGYTWRSLFIAALFAVHPVNVESVAWTAERKNVLSMLFFLLAMHAYVWYTRRPRMGRYAVIVLVFALALLSKPQVITFPFLLLLFDYWPLRRVGEGDEGVPAPLQGWPNVRSPRRSLGWLVLEKVPFLILSIASAVITIKAQKAGGAVQSLTQYSPLLRSETAVIAYARYLGKALWPARLVALYPHPTRLYPLWQVGAALGLLVLITAAVFYFRGRGYALFGWFWFLGVLVPMLGLVQVGAQAMADRYAYIPFIGLFVMMTWLAADSVAAYRKRTRRFSILTVAVPAIFCLATLGFHTYRQVSYWHDTQSFWERTIALTENNYVAHDSLGEYLARRGDMEGAVVHFRAALAIRPDDLPANLNLGTYYHGHGNLRAAIERYQMVAVYAGDPGLRATAYGNLGSAYRSLGDPGRAKQSFEEAIKAQPEHAMPMVLIGLGLIAESNGDFAEAVRDYSRAMAAEPTDVGYLLLAQALEDEGRNDEASAIRERVSRLSSDPEGAKRQAEALRGK